MENLKSLIDELGIDIGSPVKEKKSIQQNQLFYDSIDSTVIKFNSECSMRGKTGHYMSAVPFVSDSDPSNLEKAQTHYILGVRGQGIGEIQDCLVFVNADAGHSREDQGEIKYGMTVAFRSPFARERFLGVREGGRPAFGRSVFGQSEKWLLLKASSPHAGGGRMTSVSGIEEVASRGRFVRAGDLVLLQACYSGETLLSAHESEEGLEPKLAHKELGDMGGEVWQIERFAAPPPPAWTRLRPYLSGSFLRSPREPSADIVARCFSGYSPFDRSPSGSSLASSLQPLPAPPLSFLPPALQQAVFIRDLLLALSGLEGQYIRVRAQPSMGGGVGTSSPSRSFPYHHPTESSVFPVSSPVYVVVDGEGGDRAISNQVSQLLPLCDCLLALRSFLQMHSRSDLGSVSRALSGGLKEVLKEMDVLIAQIEHLFLTSQPSNNQTFHPSPPLSIQSVVFLLQPSLTCFRSLGGLASQMKDVTGGALLDSLYSFCLDQGGIRGSGSTSSLIESLTQRAAQPFLDMLALWIFRGQLIDPYGEFMIREDRSLSRDALSEDFNSRYWDGRFTLRDGSRASGAVLGLFVDRELGGSGNRGANHVPGFLRSVAPKALAAGKYLAIIRDCIKDLGNAEEGELMEESEERGLGGRLGSAGHFSYDSGGAFSTEEKSSSLRSTEEVEEEEWDRDRMLGSKVSSGKLKLFLPKFKKLSLEMKGIGRGCATLHREIERAHQFASRSLLELLDKGHNLFSHLRSLRRFFLLEHGDFYIQFMDLAEGDLKKEVGEVPLPRVQSLMQLAMQTSTLSSDPHREDLTCRLEKHSLLQHLSFILSAGESGHVPATLSPTSGLKGVEALTLDYQVGWPLSLVLSRRAITKYQVLSRLLYLSKYVERCVLDCWQGYQQTKGLSGVRSLLSEAYCLRHRMLQFLQNFVYYMSLEVVGPKSHEMLRSMARARDLDEVMSLHEAFLDFCLKECLLTSLDLLSILMKLLNTCQIFADEMRRFSSISEVQGQEAQERQQREQRARPRGRVALDKTSRSTEIEKEKERSREGIETLRRHKASLSARQTAQTTYLTEEASHESFGALLVKFSDHFDSQLRLLLEQLWNPSQGSVVQVSTLCVRLDYNGYYSEKFRNASKTK